MKYYIFQQKCLGNKPNKSQLQTEIAFIYAFENERAVRILLESILVYDFYQTCFFALDRTFFYISFY